MPLAKVEFFLDVAGALAGRGDFTKLIYSKVETCRLLVCLIGPTWQIVNDANGRRLDNPDDLVRREIDLALQRNKTVLPVLVNGATIPNRSSLPTSISELVKFDAIPLRHERFEADLDNLVNAARVALRSNRPDATVPLSNTLRSSDILGEFSPTMADFVTSLPKASPNVEPMNNALERYFSLIESGAPSNALSSTKKSV
jgi:hypothetical protein